MDYSVFDSLLDATFVVDASAKIVYCNDLAAAICGSSVKRIMGKGHLGDFIKFAQNGTLPFESGAKNAHDPSQLVETDYSALKTGKDGKVQLSVRPVADGEWVLFLRDVSLEETLAAKYHAELQQREEYAKNLEKIVAERTVELRRINKTLEAILDSLGQGFFTFNIGGDCGPVFTKACQSVLETLPTGKKVWDVLKVQNKDREHFKEWMEATIRESLPFEDLKDLGPQLFPHSHARHVSLEYYPIRPDGGEISEIVVVATDKTAEFEAQKALEAERRHAAMIAGFVKNKEQFLKFVETVPTHFRHLRGLAQTLSQRESVVETFRLLHTMEGEAAVFSIGELRAYTRVSQQILEPLREGGAASKALVAAYSDSLTTMEVGFKSLMNANAEVFGLGTTRKGKLLEIPSDSIRAFRENLRIENPDLLGDYDDRFLKVPASTLLKHYDRLVQSVSERLGKKTEPLKINGGDIRIFSEQYQNLFSALVHAFRNSLDHGIETPEEREASGKSPAGRLELNLSSQNGHLRLRVSDDGRGIDPEKIRAKLTATHPDRDFAKMNDDEIVQQVALPGFSSRDSVGEFSGRGVGLDALRAEALRLGGTFHIRSHPGDGTVIEILIPNMNKKPGDLRSA